MRPKLLVAGLGAAGVAAAFYLVSLRAPELVLSEALLEQALAKGLGGAVPEWDELSVSLVPPAASLRGVRARFRGEPAAQLRASRVDLQFDPAALEAGAFELAAARFEGLRIELAGAALSHRVLRLRVLEVRGVDALKGLGKRLEGQGKLEGGGALEFEWAGLRPSGSNDLVESADPAVVQAAVSLNDSIDREDAVEVGDAVEFEDSGELAVDFAHVPAAEWGGLVPELRDASGTISGRIDVELRRRSTASQARRTSDAADPGRREATAIQGRFEIDASEAGLLLAGAYRKPSGDPASLTGRFRSSPGGNFELLEARLSIRKAKSDAAGGRSAGDHEANR